MKLDKTLDKISKKINQIEKLHDKESLLCEEVKDFVEEIRENYVEEEAHDKWEEADNDDLDDDLDDEEDQEVHERDQADRDHRGLPRGCGISHGEEPHDQVGRTDEAEAESCAQRQGREEAQLEATAPSQEPLTAVPGLREGIEGREIEIEASQEA